MTQDNLQLSLTIDRIIRGAVPREGEAENVRIRCKRGHPERKKTCSEISPSFFPACHCDARKKGVVVALLTIESSDDCDVDAVVTSLFALLLPSFLPLLAESH
jgi:hypothetical protein